MPTRRRTFRRRLLQSIGLIQPPKPAFWLFGLPLAASLYVMGAQQIQYLYQQPAAWLFSLALLSIVAIPAVLFIRRLDRFNPKPAMMITAAALWGALVAITLSVYANTYFLEGLQRLLPAPVFERWGLAICAPVTEELFKGSGLLVLLFLGRRHFKSPTDGLVYGLVIGLAFQTVENLAYFMHAATVSGPPGIGAIAQTFLGRVIVAGLYTHVLFSGLAGFGFGYAVTQRNKRWVTRLGVLLAFGLIARGAHFFWNSPLLNFAGGGQLLGTFVVAAMKGTPFLLLLVALILRARRNGKHLFAHRIAAEIGTDVLTDDEFHMLTTSFGRVAALLRVLKSKGRQALPVVAALHREQIELALFHPAVSYHQHRRLQIQRARVRRLKARLDALGSA